MQVVLFLKQNLPKSIEFRSILGGLAPDSDVPMGAELRQTIQQSWHRIEQQCADTHFNFDFWTNNIPRRSTYPSCRAVLVAQQHGLEAEMIAQIQHAYYQAAQNPSDEAILCDCAHAIGLDPDMFRRALHHPDTEQAFAAQRQNLADPTRFFEHLLGVFQMHADSNVFLGRAVGRQDAGDLELLAEDLDLVADGVPLA